MKKQHYTAEIPVSNPYNFAAFEDLIANIQSGYNEEKSTHFTAEHGKFGS